MSAGESVAIMVVLELPPRLSLSSQVRIESRYGTKSAPAFFFFFGSGDDCSAWTGTYVHTTAPGQQYTPT